MLIELAERAWVPDPLVRFGIRSLLRERLRDEHGSTSPSPVWKNMNRGPIAVAVDDANRQHYEVPAEFFQKMLGPWMKYSSCLWEDAADLETAERRMLELSCERAEIRDGMRVLDLGCGWGSMTLWIAQSFPLCRVEAVSNSASQAAFIRARCRELGLTNVTAHTADINRFDPGARFDRIVSVEMFEHMRNYERLLQNIESWLAPGGKLFVHIFTHRHLTYFFETDGRNDWMARHFFTGGVMPSRDLLSRFDRHLRVEADWPINGTHYARTLRAWLDRLDRQRDEVLELFREIYGSDGPRWLQRWRLFLLACEELFAYGGGEEWGVTHYRLRRAHQQG